MISRTYERETAEWRTNGRRPPVLPVTRFGGASSLYRLEETDRKGAGPCPSSTRTSVPISEQLERALDGMCGESDAGVPGDASTPEVDGGTGPGTSGGGCSCRVTGAGSRADLATWSVPALFGLLGLLIRRRRRR